MYSSCVNLHFAYNCRLWLDIFLPCDSKCPKLNFRHSYILKLDVFISYGTFGILNPVFFWLTCYLILYLFPVTFHYRCVNLNFAHFCSIKLHVLPFPYHSTCVKLNLMHTYSLKLDVLHLPAILDLLNSLLRLPIS